jgi:histidinol-phosphate phosphatase family protein
MPTRNQVAILAGGLGKRLRALLGDLPKPMIPIAGRPLLEHQIELARHHGFTRIAIFACYRADVIRKHFGDGSQWGVELEYIVEREPLGTAGAVCDRLEVLDERFLVMYGDTMLNVDLARLWRAHEQFGADATLLLHPNNHPFDSDLVEMDGNGRITAFHNRPHDAGRYFQNLVNAGLYVIEKQALRDYCSRTSEAGASKDQPPFSRGRQTGSAVGDFGKDAFPWLVAKGAHLHGYNSPEFIKDIGTPDRYHWVCAQHEAGIIGRGSFETATPAVFLDRDGTLIEEVTEHGIATADQLTLLPGVAEAVHALNQAGLRIVVVTNQPIVAKGMATEADIQAQHNKLETLLGRGHAFVDRIYWCPHHPEKGFPGERAELKIECDCRKPRTGMIQRAAAELNLDLSRSWLIGDTTTDIQTAKNAGLRSILVETGHGGRDKRFAVVPDFVFPALNDAVQRILLEREGCGA